VWIDYAILAVISMVMFLYAYYRRPDGGTHDNDSDGGIPTGGDSSPSDDPPTVSVPDPDQEREPAGA